MKYLVIFSFLILLSTSVNTSRPDKRNFVSGIIDEFITNIKPRFKDQKLATIFENCFPNTLDTTVEYDKENNDTFVITGDIEAMWLRDSSFQVLPYLPFAGQDQQLHQMMLALIKRHTRSILIDPYANAFNKNETFSPWQSDETYKLLDGQRVPAMNPKLWERKYELDSPISALFFAVNFYEKTKDSSFIDSEWLEALERVINLVKKEMRSTEEEDNQGGPEYFFQRSAKESFDSLHQGRGNPVNSCGLVKTMFRNSDDATTFSYNIPENAFLVSTFNRLLSILSDCTTFRKRDRKFIRPQETNTKLRMIVEDLKNISRSVNESIYLSGVFTDPKSGENYFAYEVDCFGNHYFMDDPGYPSLISMPFFGFITRTDYLYLSTRKRVLSNKNPYFYKGSSGEGLGSSHTARNYIWPLFTIMRVLTSNNENEIVEGINLLAKSAENTGFMHESFNVNDVGKFTRSWFAWANSFFGLMINQINENYPQLLLNKNK